MTAVTFFIIAGNTTGIHHYGGVVVVVMVGRVGGESAFGICLKHNTETQKKTIR